VDGKLDLLGAGLRTICGGTVGCTGGVVKRELWRNNWMYWARG